MSEEELALRLIEIAKRNPRIRAALYELLVEHFVTKDEVKRILEELKAMREDYNRRMEELRREFNERIEALERRMEEMRADFNERMESLERRMVELREDFNRRMEEMRADFNRQMVELRTELTREIELLREQLSALGTRWGLLAEDAFRNAIRGILSRYGLRVEKWEYFDRDGLVYGEPSVVEVDVLIKDGEHMLLEIKSSVDRSDVAELVRIGELYERVTGVKPILAIVSPYIRERARELAKRRGILVFTSSEELVRELGTERRQ